ncbi:hypothetical protein CRI94_05555 [Longibacter salinarum]|uniref:Uncharacterized protein n=1 Tax=Longibacter salinarum TaxID=1850348 RepID=A0A2A8D0S9_9BACT|nr:FecR domain-containing protein [Longibacter salinarum]PEN14491.1 hypothetical protein CRI94_05555 [Longibacter salinarum]
MNDLHEAILFFEDLPPSQREDVLERLETDPDAAKTFHQWRTIERRIAEDFHNDLPERHLLVLFALEDRGDRGLLSTQEQMALDEARGDIERAMKRHPSLSDVVDNIQDARADFDDVWEKGWSESAASKSTRSVNGPLDTDPNIDLDVAPSALDPSTGRQDRSARASSGSASRTWRRIGATALVAAMAVLVVFLWPTEPERTVITVAEGETQVVDLADGSTVRLAGATQLSFNDATNSTFDRQVTLDFGRAFFEVAEKPRPQPFIVETPTSRTTVLGTQFGVEAEEDVTDVTLASGKVKVQSISDTSREVDLAPGQQSRVEKDAAPSAPKNVNLIAELGWSGLYIFNRTPVEEIASQLENRHNISVSIAPALQGEPVTGTFEQSMAPEEILSVVATALGANLEQDESGYTLVLDDQG